MNTFTPQATPNFEHLIQHSSDCSRYVRRLLGSDNSLALWLQENYSRPCNAEEMHMWLNAMPAKDEAELAASLRNLRKRVMLKLITRDMGGMAGLNEVMACMTALAELAVQRALDCAMQALKQQYGQPIGSESGTPSSYSLSAWANSAAAN